MVDALSVMIGRTQFDCDLIVDLLAHGHWIITGETRSGKSVMSYALLGQAASYPCIRVVGIDPTALLLKPFQHRGIDDPWISTDPDDVPRWVRILEGIKCEMDRRNGTLFDRGLDKIGSVTPAEPLVLVVLEEFPGIIRRAEAFDSEKGLKPAERLGPRVRSLIESLVAEAAKSAIRVVLIAQRADASIIGGYARENLTVRVSFRISSASAIGMLFEGLSEDERKSVTLFPPGQGLIRTPGPQPPVVFRADFVQSYKYYVDHVMSCDPRLLLSRNISTTKGVGS